MSKCNCKRLYLLAKQPLCLHKLFSQGHVQIMTKEKSWRGTRFYLYKDKPAETSAAWKNKWWRNGLRTRLEYRDEILLAIELADKYNIRKVNL